MYQIHQYHMIVSLKVVPKKMKMMRIGFLCRKNRNLAATQSEKCQVAVLQEIRVGYHMSVWHGPYWILHPYIICDSKRTS